MGFPWHGGLGIDDGSPLHFLPRFQLGSCLEFKAVLSPADKTGGFRIGCAGRGKSSQDAYSAASVLPGEGDILLEEAALFA